MLQPSNKLVKAVKGYNIDDTAVLVVSWLTKLARDCEVLGSKPATFKRFSRKCAVLQFARISALVEEMEEKQ